MCALRFDDFQEVLRCFGNNAGEGVLDGVHQHLISLSLYGTWLVANTVSKTDFHPSFYSGCNQLTEGIIAGTAIHPGRDNDKLLRCLAQCPF